MRLTKCRPLMSVVPPASSSTSVQTVRGSCARTYWISGGDNPKRQPGPSPKAHVAWGSRWLTSSGYCRSNSSSERRIGLFMIGSLIELPLECEMPLRPFHCEDEIDGVNVAIVKGIGKQIGERCLMVGIAVLHKR